MACKREIAAWQRASKKADKYQGVRNNCTEKEKWGTLTSPRHASRRCRKSIKTAIRLRDAANTNGVKVAGCVRSLNRAYFASTRKYTDNDGE